MLLAPHHFFTFSLSLTSSLLIRCTIVAFTTPKLGISIAVAKFDGIKTLTVRSCTTGSEGELGGVQSGDILYGVDGDVYPDMNHMVRALQSSTRPLRVGFKRPGGYVKKQSKAEARAAQRAAAKALERSDSLGAPGMPVLKKVPSLSNGASTRAFG